MLQGQFLKKISLKKVMQHCHIGSECYLIHTWTTHNIKSKQYPCSCNEHTETQQEPSEEPNTSSYTQQSCNRHSW